MAAVNARAGGRGGVALRAATAAGPGAAAAAPAPRGSWGAAGVVASQRRGAGVRARAAGPPPEGVSVPSREPDLPKQMFGFCDTAEVWNSRFAMVGFFALLFVELVFHKGLLEMMGLNVGTGLGFEF